MTWEAEVESVIKKGETVLPYIQKGLTALATDPNVADLIKALPVLKPYADRLIGLIPVVGEVYTALTLIDFLLAHETELKALGVVLHFAPADALNYVPFKEDHGDTGF